MALADWLASGADPAKMTPEEVRRRQQLCAVREEQASTRLEARLVERDEVFRRGAATTSTVLRRVLARRWSLLQDEVRTMERELARISKESAGLAVLRHLQREGTPLKAPGDCTPLLTLLDDASSSEDEFAAKLATGVGGTRSDARTGPVSAGTGTVLAAWIRIDKGEIKSADEALRRLDER
ncbi:MAG: hypothetical protein K8T90_19420 [Planctomycetes bacterium]|nr:hypothetical protein [Planctomycetota bacterium]